MQVFGVASCGKMLKSVNVFLKMRGFHCVGDGSVLPPPNCQAARRKAHRLALAEAPILLFVSYSVNKILKFVNVCLECPVFNALGAAVSCPQSLAGRWAGRRAEWRVTWPWRRCQCKIFVPYRVGKMLESVSVF